MKTPPQPFTITIPAAIVALPDLSLPERVVLTHLANFPRCGNGKLARLTWLSIRGVESLISRLLKKGHLQRVSVDGSRHLLCQGITATHTECGDSHTAKPHTACGVMAGTIAPTPPATSMTEGDSSMPLVEVLAYRAELAGLCVDRWAFRDARLHYEASLKRVAVEVDLSDERRARLLAESQRSANCLFALEYLTPKRGVLSPNELEDLISKLACTPSEKLIDFRQQVESGACIVRMALEFFGLVLPSDPKPVSTTHSAPSAPRLPAVHSAPGAQHDSQNDEEQEQPTGSNH